MAEKEPRWEAKYNEYKNSEPISEKISNIEKLTKSNISKIKGRTTRAVKKLQAEIESLKNEKVTGDFKTKEEYEQAVENHKALISSKENKIIELKNKSQEEIEQIKNNPETNKKLQGYKNYEKNKDKIKNILEYREELKENLKKIPKDTSQEIANKKQEQNERATEIEAYKNIIERIKTQLKGEISDGDKQILLLALKTRMDEMGELQAKQSQADREIADLAQSGKDFDEKAKEQKDTYERKIAKCNIIAANLLKGKDIGEFELNVDSSGKTYISPDGKLNKKIEEAKNEKTYKYDEEKGKFVKQEDDKNVEDKKTEGLKENMPARISDFAQKYPFIAKIGNFFKNMKNKVVDFFKNSNLLEDRETQKEREKIIDEIMKENEEKLSQDKSFEEIMTAEDKLLKDIAIKGQKVVEKEEKQAAQKREEDRRASFRAKYAANKQAAADRFAEKFGGNYERQDGATQKYNPNYKDEGR